MAPNIFKAVFGLQHVCDSEVFSSIFPVLLERERENFNEVLEKVLLFEQYFIRNAMEEKGKLKLPFQPFLPAHPTKKERKKFLFFLLLNKPKYYEL